MNSSIGTTTPNAPTPLSPHTCTCQQLRQLAQAQAIPQVCRHIGHCSSQCAAEQRCSVGSVGIGIVSGDGVRSVATPCARLNTTRH